MGTKILTGNNMDKLKEIHDSTVDCVVSSPPYFGLRDYGTGTWEGGNPNCNHADDEKLNERLRQKKSMIKVGEETDGSTRTRIHDEQIGKTHQYVNKCKKCGAKRIDEQFGLEETLEEYIDKTVLLFEELRRVLKPQGTVWWNLGDSYANKSSAWGGRGKNSILNDTGLEDKQRRNTIVPEGLKAKDLMMIPARVAIALSENGWYLRSEIIWHKPNPMPESVKDRPTSAHEKIYLFSKNKKYYYDADAIREKAKTKPTIRNKSAEGYQADYAKGKRFSEGERTYGNGYANKRNVWSTKYESDEEERMYRQGMSKTRGENVVFVRTKLPTQEDFVKFIKLKTSIKQLDEETDIKKTTIEHWFRSDESGFAFPSVEDWKAIRDYVNDWSKEFESMDEGLTYVESHLDSIESNPLGKNKRNVWTVTTKPFKGAHFAVFPTDLIEPCIKAGCPKGGTVLDPFGGSGTTGLVANNLGRNAILIELNEEYVEIAKKRLGEDLGLFSEVQDG